MFVRVALAVVTSKPSLCITARIKILVSKLNEKNVIPWTLIAENDSTKKEKS
jgi:hypothetical protein